MLNLAPSAAELKRLKRNTYARLYRARNGEQVKKYNAEWHAKNKDKAAALNKKWRLENPDRRRTLTWLFYERNPGARTAIQGKRRAAQLNATPPWADLEKIKAIYREAADRGLEVDHIYPLQHPRCCGLHVHYNLQLLSASENARKRNKLPCSI